MAVAYMTPAYAKRLTNTSAAVIYRVRTEAWFVRLKKLDYRPDSLSALAAAPCTARIGTVEPVIAPATDGLRALKMGRESERVFTAR
jgi:hypothetical protein